MPYRSPTFPLQLRLWRGPHSATLPPLDPPDLEDVPCQLRPLRTAASTPQQSGANAWVQVLLPPRTDVRPETGGATHADYLEIPQGTGRFYVVVWVEDVMRGFDTEYRLAGCRQLWYLVGGVPIPIP